METEKLKEEPAPADIPGLVAQARAAYQQNRVRECLALTKAVMLVDPGNSAAVEMQSAVRFDMQRDLSDARALIEESRNKPEAPKYRKAAEIILLKTLYLDPDSEGAKTLLSSIKSAAEVQPVPVAVSAHTPLAPPVAAPPAIPSPVVVAAAPPTAVTPLPAVTPPGPIAEPLPATPVEFFKEKEKVREEAKETIAPVTRAEVHTASFVSPPESPLPDAIPFTTGTTYVDRPEKKKKKQSSVTVPVVIAAIAVLGGGLLLARQHTGSVRTADASSLPAQAEKLQTAAAALPVSNPPASSTEPLPPELPNPKVAEAAPAKTALTALNSAAANSAASAAGSAAAAVPSRPVPVNTAAAGSLAVSSPIAAEIYMDDKYLGSTPATLQLPAGSQTIEYRHGDLRSVMTHVMKANEVTTALVTFNVQVQLNARPWANVSIEGSPRIQMGQTPLSDVSLPIGTVLVFENPNFPSKSHKIDINDKTIQIAFP